MGMKMVGGRVGFGAKLCRIVREGAQAGLNVTQPQPETGWEQ